MTIRPHTAVRALLTVAIFSQLGQNLSVSQTSSAFHEELQDTSLFAAMTRIALQNRQPLGIVIGSDRRLCSIRPKVSISGNNLENALENAAKTEGYQVEKIHSVIVVSPHYVSAEEAKVLNLKLENFAPPAGPAHLLGSFLLTYTWGTLHPNEGTIADVPLSESSRDVKLTPIPNSTPIDNASRIASENGGGIWVITFSERPDLTARERAVDLESLSIFSYNEDASMIDHLNCQTPALK